MQKNLRGLGGAALGLGVAAFLLFSSAGVTSPLQTRDESPIQEPAPLSSTVTSINAPGVLDPAGVQLRSTLSPSLLGKVDRSPIPVLLPSHGLNDADISLSQGEHWVAVSISTDSFSMVINGTRLLFYPGSNGRGAANEIPDGSDGEVDSGRPAPVSLEGIWRASWNEYGAAYSFKLYCQASDHCPSEIEVDELLQSLVYVGGASE